MTRALTMVIAKIRRQESKQNIKYTSPFFSSPLRSSGLPPLISSPCAELGAVTSIGIATRQVLASGHPLTH